MHILNASSESVVSCLGSTTVHWSVQLGSKWLHVPHSLPVVSVYAYTLHTRYKSVAMHRFRLMIHI